MSEGIFFNGSEHKSKFIEQMLRVKLKEDRQIAEIYIDSGLLDPLVKTCFKDSMKKVLKYTEAFTDAETDLLIQAIKIYKGRL